MCVVFFLFFLTAACFCALSTIFAEIRGVHISFCSLRNQPFVMSQNKLLPHWYLCTCAPPPPPDLGSPCDCPIQTRGVNVQETIFTDNSKQRAKCAVLDRQCFDFIHLTKLCWIPGWKIKSLKIMGPLNLTRAKENGNNELWSFCWMKVITPSTLSAAVCVHLVF